MGFLVLAFEDDKPPYGWRLLIAAERQGQGLGAAAFRLLCDAARERPPDADVRPDMLSQSLFLGPA